MFAQGLVAASKMLPRQRVTQASMYFPKAAAFDAPLDVVVDVVREGRTFSTVEVRVNQDDKLRSIGLYLLDAGSPDVIDGSVAMPDVAGPADAEPYDMRVTGRELRIVNGDYRPDPDHVGPPELHCWIRFRDAPSEPYLHAALMAQPTTHWTIAAAMLPHPGFGEAQAHRTLSTGIMARQHGVPRRRRRDAVAALLEPGDPRGPRPRAGRGSRVHRGRPPRRVVHGAGDGPRVPPDSRRDGPGRLHRDVTADVRTGRRASRRCRPAWGSLMPAPG